MKVDALILGAGPAATSTALSLLRSGVSVCLLARNDSTTTIDVEILSPEIRAELAAVGIHQSFWQPLALPCYGIRSAWGAEPPSYYSYMSSPHGDAMAVNRRAFHAALRQQLQGANAPLINGRLLGTQMTSNGDWAIAVAHEGTTKVVHANVVVDCSGRRAAVARSLGAEQTRIDNLYAISAVLCSHDTCQELTVEATENGWWYAAPPVDGKVFVCFLSDVDLIRDLRAINADVWLRLLAQTRQIAAKVTATNTCTLHCHPSYSAILKPGAGPTWLAVGDAAIAFDPLASIGVLSAVTTGRTAARAIMTHLNGNRESLATLDQCRRAAFQQYLHTRRRHYAAENRWPKAIFWNRRNGLDQSPANPRR